MSGILELIQKIEELRAKLIQISDGKAYTDPEVVAASQKLDEVLDKYQRVIAQEKENKK